MSKVAACFIVAALGFGAFATSPAPVAAQQKYQFKRTYHEGDKDVFTMVNELEGAQAMTMHMEMTQTVKKVYPDGSADVETAMKMVSMTMNGHDMQLNRDLPGSTMRFAPSGGIIGGPAEKNARAQAFSAAFQGMNGLQNGLVVGQAVPFDVRDAKNADLHSKGEVKLLDVKDGIGTVQCSMDIIDDKHTDATGHMEGKYTIDFGAGKMNHAEIKVTKLNGQEGMNMTMTLDRKAG